MPSFHDQYHDYSLDDLLRAIEVAAMPATPQGQYLKALLGVRTAEMVSTQLAETARTTADSASAIKDQLGCLTAKLTEATEKLEAASAQSGKLGTNLNWLTAALVIAAILTAGASGFQGWEMRRQADLAEQQLQIQKQQAALKQTTK